MAWDWMQSAVGLVVGVVVGLTGMGGGALMTPVLILLLGVPANVAVSSDVVASLFIKPVGAAVHMRRGSIDFSLVRYLCFGSIPAAFLGAVLVNRAFEGANAESTLRPLLGSALLIASVAIVIKTLRRPGPDETAEGHAPKSPGWAIGIGAAGGLIVGMTSVGSGSLVIVLLMLAYPALSAARLVGTDLAQAIPLVASAAVGHLFFGNVNAALTASLLTGALPGVWIGAHLSAKAQGHWLRPVLLTVLLASSLKLLGLSLPLVLLSATAFAVASIWATHKSTAEQRRPA